MVANSAVNGDKSVEIDGDKPLVGLRWILVAIIFFTLIPVFFMRNCMSVAIVAMVDSNSTSDSEYDTDDETDVCPAAANRSDSSESNESSGEFSWTSSEQGFVVGAYFWGFILARLFLSRLCERFGHWKSISLGLTIAGVLMLLSPLCAEVSPYLLAANRFIVGATYGPNPASLQCLFAAWAPKNELGLMSTVSYSGYAIGGLVSLFVSGWLSENLGWRSIFYVGGALALITPPLWIFFVKDHPKDHPKLTAYERNLLKDNINIRTQKNVPWLKIITSPYVLICMFSFFARYWIDMTTSVDAPAFLNYKIGLDLDTASYVTGASSLLCFIGSILCGAMSDFIMSKNYLTKANTRKLCHIIGTLVPSFLLLGVTFADCNQTPVIILFIIIGFFVNATGVSFALSTIDIAPNYTAVVNALMAIGVLAGAVAPSITSALLKKENGWNKSFYLTIAFNLLSCILYVLFMTADPQPWNFSKEKKKSVEDENEASNEPEKY
ncbi:UNVERIFIED_CONTAM: hypothetical protein RMT77_017604 [Armadillidium vulgare]